jgi:AcrR family transcriptional regulator
MMLFLERGYAEVAVADIAERAGLTKRSFFNHFTDKREVLFADATAFERTIIDHLADVDPGTGPLDAALAALTYGGMSLASYRHVAAARRDLITAAAELEERHLGKLASLTHALTDGLIARGAPARAASFSAEAAVIVFSAAYDDWIDHPDADFSALIDGALDDLRAAVEPSAPR